MQAQAAEFSGCAEKFRCFGEKGLLAHNKRVAAYGV
jgi:hypothetical protein